MHTLAKIGKSFFFSQNFKGPSPRSKNFCGIHYGEKVAGFSELYLYISPGVISMGPIEMLSAPENT